jgi:hypothetical protein
MLLLLLLLLLPFLVEPASDLVNITFLLISTPSLWIVWHQTRPTSVHRACHELHPNPSLSPHRRPLSHALPPVRLFRHVQQVRSPFTVAHLRISSQQHFPYTRSRGEGLTIQDSSHDDLPQGFRIVSVDGVSIVDMTQMEVRKCFPVSPADCVITVCLESDLMGMNESNPVVRIPMWKEAQRVASRSATPALQLQQQVPLPTPRNTIIV